MELRDLRCFLVLAEELSFTRTANRLNVAQPPLSRRIRQLEEELGARLFERHTRKVALTHAGSVFLKSVAPLMTSLDCAIDACREADRGVKGRLRVGYTGRASQVLLPVLVRACRQEFPDVVLDIQGPNPTGSLKAALLNDQLDVALCFLPVDDAQIATRSYVECEFALALSESHRAARFERVPLASLSEDAFVGYPANKGYHLRSAMDAECRRAGFFPRVVHETDASQVLLCLIAAGSGVSVIPRELEHLAESKGVVFKALEHEGAHCISHGMAWLRQNKNPALRNLLEADLPLHEVA